MKAHARCAEDQAFLRQWLTSAKLVAFVADGAVLPRRSGIDDRPLTDHCVRFEAPDSLARHVTLPHRGQIRGMGIPEGITLIVGGGFHGKSTLLHALERGVYNHVPDDGRECVVTVESAVKIRAEDGRFINRVDISPFITNLPFNKDTRTFSTDNASGSTSQAANIGEAVACGTRLLLIDEDTSATNFMIRDEKMQALVSKDKEPITPFLHRVQELHRAHGISSIIVMGGSGDYFGVSDTVIMMDTYRPIDVTAKAHALASASHPTATPVEDFAGAPRRFPPELFTGKRDEKPVKIRCRGEHRLLYGHREIDLSRVEQLIDTGQTRAIGLLLHYCAGRYLPHHDLITSLRLGLADVEQHGLDVIAPFRCGDLALPRLYELAAAANRLRP